MNTRTATSSGKVYVQTFQSPPGPVKGAMYREYRISDKCVVPWSPYRGENKLLLDCGATLAALQVSSLYEYRVLYDQAWEFFEEVAIHFGGKIPEAMIPMTVVHAGVVSGLPLGTFFHIRYLAATPKCVIPERIMVGEWKHIPVRY